MVSIRYVMFLIAMGISLLVLASSFKVPTSPINAPAPKPADQAVEIATRPSVLPGVELSKPSIPDVTTFDNYSAPNHHNHLAAAPSRLSSQITLDQTPACADSLEVLEPAMPSQAFTNVVIFNNCSESNHTLLAQSRLSCDITLDLTSPCADTLGAFDTAKRSARVLLNSAILSDVPLSRSEMVALRSFIDDNCDPLHTYASQMTYKYQKQCIRADKLEAELLLLSDFVIVSELAAMFARYALQNKTSAKWNAMRIDIIGLTQRVYNGSMAAADLEVISSQYAATWNITANLTEMFEVDQGRANAFHCDLFTVKTQSLFLRHATSRKYHPDLLATAQFYLNALQNIQLRSWDRYRMMCCFEDYDNRSAKDGAPPMRVRLGRWMGSLRVFKKGWN